MKMEENNISTHHYFTVPILPFFQKGLMRNFGAEYTLIGNVVSRYLEWEKRGGKQKIRRSLGMVQLCMDQHCKQFIGASDLQPSSFFILSIPNFSDSKKQSLHNARTARYF